MGLAKVGLEIWPTLTFAEAFRCENSKGEIFKHGTLDVVNLALQREVLEELQPRA